MPSRTPPTLADFAILLLVSLLWGSSFMFIEIALRTFGPLSLAASRIVLAGIFLYIVARALGERFPTDKATLKRLALMGLCGTAPFILISWAQQTIDSSTAAIVMAVPTCPSDRSRSCTANSFQNVTALCEATYESSQISPSCSTRLR